MSRTADQRSRMKCDRNFSDIERLEKGIGQKIIRSCLSFLFLVSGRSSSALCARPEVS